MWLRNTGLKKTVVLLVVAVEHRGNIRWSFVWLRNTGLKSKVGFNVVAKHCFFNAVVLLVVAQNYFEKQW